MSTRTGTSPGTPASRRAQRSTRLTVAVVLILLAALAVAGTAATGSWLLVTVAGVVAVLLGAIATRITHAELVATRRAAGQDRAALAQSYRKVTDDRVDEHAAYVAHVQATAALREQALTELEVALVEAQRRAALASTEVTAQARRADAAEATLAELTLRTQQADESASTTLPEQDEAELESELEGEVARRIAAAESGSAAMAARLDAAEHRAAEAIVRVAELEQEIDVTRAELEAVTVAWHAAEHARRHA